MAACLDEYRRPGRFSRHFSVGHAFSARFLDLTTRPTATRQGRWLTAATAATIDRGPSARQDIAMDRRTLRFEVSKAKISWSTYLQDLMRPKFGGGFKSYSGRGPSVVAENGMSETRVIEVAKTMKEARDRAATIEQEFKTLSTSEWCELYNVPASFVAGDAVG
jgi:hypothetical protein